LGAEAHLSAGDLRWLSPLALWSGITAGPIAWAIELTVSYAIVKRVCASRNDVVLHLITILSLAIVAGGGLLSGNAYQRTAQDRPTDGSSPRQRARFMAILGLALSGFFLVVIIASALPNWVIDACQ